MEEKEIQFRTTAFGGFQKRDVLDYLEKSAREHGEAINTLQRELGAVRKEKADGEQTCAQLEDRVRTLEEENSRLRDQLAQQEAKLTQTAEGRDTLEETVRQLQAKVDELTPGCAAYESIKDRTASIELEAHGRARAIEMGAHEKLKKSRSQLLAWMEKVQASYDRMRLNLNDSMERASQELDRVEKSLTGVAEQFRQHDEALKGLKAQVESLEGPRAPQPLPLEDEES